LRGSRITPIDGRLAPVGPTTPKRAGRLADASVDPTSDDTDAFLNSARRAEIVRDVSPHILRHTFATTALQKGISLPTVQKILGHDRLAMTAIYLNFTDVHIQDEFERKW
jgi:integrase